MTDYQYDYQLDDELNNNFLELGISTCLINGYIYRGDSHKNIVLSSSPKFYGTYNSASKYVEEGHYFKRYSTVRTLRLLKLTNDKINSKNILNFFINIILKKDTLTNNLDVKIGIILLQVLFGIIDISLNKLDLTDSIIKKYLVDNKIDNNLIELLLKIIKDLESKNTNTIPSRCSMRSLDKLLMKILKEILIEYEIDGTYYFQLPSYNDIKNLPNLLCNKVNNSYEFGSTCVPSEICIFSPGTSLGGVIFWKKINGKLSRVKFYKKFKRYIRNKYNKLSLVDIYMLTKLYKSQK